MENVKFDFLLKEYDEMFAEKRYYDGRFYSLLSLYISLITFTVTAVVIVTNVISFQANVLNGIVSLFDCLVGIIIFISLYFNRVNYVKVCRQINAIRNFCLRNYCSDFAPFNHMYTNDKFPKYNMLKSIHFILMVFLAVCNSIFLSFAILLFLYSYFQILSFILAALFCLLVVAAQILLLDFNTKKRDMNNDSSQTF